MNEKALSRPEVIQAEVTPTKKPLINAGVLCAEMAELETDEADREEICLVARVMDCLRAEE
jgi:hypothetical protein